MFLLRRPHPGLIRRVLDSQRDLPLSYSSAGMTREGRAHGYPLNYHRVRLGNGAQTFAGAVSALQRWAMYDMAWTHVYPADLPVEKGRVFATVAHHLGFWSINPCRIVYVEEAEEGSVRTWSFAIGTLPAHSEQGEERFCIQWDQKRGDVWFEILALARPQHWLAWLGYPYVRITQRRFGRGALACVQAALAKASH